MRDPVEREFLLAFWKIHILHHAAEERGVYGQWMLQELHRHGYRISPGTLYPILARMADRGWLCATEPFLNIMFTFRADIELLYRN